MEIKDFGSIIKEHRVPSKAKVEQLIKFAQDSIHEKIAFQPFNADWQYRSGPYVNELERDTLLSEVQKVLAEHKSQMNASKVDHDDQSHICFHVRQEVADD